MDGWRRCIKINFIFSPFFNQQMGLISVTVSLHYKFSLFDSPGVNRIECPNEVEEKTKNCLQWLSHESYCLPPSRKNLHTFYDPINILMDEFLEIQSYPWHDFISLDPYLFLIFKQQVIIASIFIYITYKPSLICCIINNKESSIHLFNKWLHWIYDFT